jgi:hypothetical protein
MYLHECLIENVGPIASLDLSFELTPDGNPKPVILVGKNGSGKTIFLSYVVDALAKLAKKRFKDVVLDQRIGHMPFVKVTSGCDSRSLTGHHLCLLEFFDSQQRLSYIEKVGTLEPESFSDRLRGRFEAIRSWPKDELLHKRAIGDEKRIESVFQAGSEQEHSAQPD